MSNSRDEKIDLMIQSDSVKIRDVGVIAKFLRDNYGPTGDDFIAAAQELINAQIDAGLGTFILDDLNSLIRELKA